MIFQDPIASLDPRMRIEDIVAEPLDCASARPDREARRRACDRADRIDGSAGFDVVASAADFLGRSGAAHRHRAGADLRSGDPVVRRARGVAGPLHPPPGAGAAAFPLRRARPLVAVHQPRPAGGLPAVRSRARSASRPHRRSRGSVREVFAQPEERLHAPTAGRRADRRSACAPARGAIWRASYRGSSSSSKLPSPCRRRQLPWSYQSPSTMRVPVVPSTSCR